MAADTILEFTDQNFETDVIQSELPVLVDFWAEWCQPCRMLTPTIEELANEYEGRLKVGKVDVDNNREVALKFGVMNIPTVFIFKGGEMQKKFVGLVSKDEYKSAIDELV
jgi:thioredoxin 1